MLKKILLIVVFCCLLCAEDQIWLNRNSQTGAERSYNYYKTAYQQNKNYESSWKYARAAQFYADNFVSDINLQKNLFNEGKNAALEAVKINPAKPEGHYWLGANYGSWAEVNGILESLNYADDIATEMTKTIELEPTYKEGSPYMIRAKVYYKAPGWPLSIGDPQKAEEDFKHAMKYGAKNRKVYRFYAEYLRNKGDKNKVQGIIEQGLALPYNTEDKITEDKELALLKELKNK